MIHVQSGRCSSGQPGRRGSRPRAQFPRRPSCPTRRFDRDRSPIAAALCRRYWITRTPSSIGAGNGAGQREPVVCRGDRDPLVQQSRSSQAGMLDLSPPRNPPPWKKTTSGVGPGLTRQRLRLPDVEDIPLVRTITHVGGVRHRLGRLEKRERPAPAHPANQRHNQQKSQPRTGPAFQPITHVAPQAWQSPAGCGEPLSFRDIGQVPPPATFGDTESLSYFWLAESGPDHESNALDLS